MGSQPLGCGENLSQACANPTCHRTARVEEYCSDCRVECKCGCGSRARYAYAPGHRPEGSCRRCDKKFAATKTDGDKTLCSQCRRHVKDGRPEKISELAHHRKMQREAPDGKHWCAGCYAYRANSFFEKRSGEDRLYGRCKPCLREQRLAQNVAKTYNMTAERYYGIKEYQGGRCAICQVANGATKTLAVDHDHSCCGPGKSCGKCVRGILCGPCNQMIGRARDSVAMLVRAVDYLTYPPADYVDDEGKLVDPETATWENLLGYPDGRIVAAAQVDYGDSQRDW